MTITPRAFLINDPIPALGKLVRPVEPEKVDPNWLFENGDHPMGTVEAYQPITEAECRQIKPKWFGYGTHDGVLRTAEERAASAKAFAQQLRHVNEWMLAAEPSNGAAQASKTEKVATTPPLPEAAPPVAKFKVGDRVRIIEGSDEPYTALVTGCVNSGIFTGGWHIQSDDSEHPGIALEREMELIPQRQNHNEWVEWKGGECPIRGKRTAHEVRFRDGWESGRQFGAQEWRWEHLGYESDIVAYRVIE